MRPILAAAILGTMVPGVLAAQSSGTTFRATDATGGTRAVETQSIQPRVVVVQPQSPTVFRRHAPAYNPYAVPVAYTLVPAVVLSNGTIVADFGYGYEPVYRSCSGAVVVGQPSTVVASNGVVLNPPAPTYTQPVPNQQTASQQMSSANRVVPRTQYSSCFSRDPYGRVLVYRF